MTMYHLKPGLKKIWFFWKSGGFGVLVYKVDHAQDYEPGITSYTSLSLCHVVFYKFSHTQKNLD